MQQIWKIMVEHGCTDSKLYEALFAHFQELMREAHERGFMESQPPLTTHNDLC